MKTRLKSVIKVGGFAQKLSIHALDDLRPEGPGGNSHDRQVVDRKPIEQVSAEGAAQNIARAMGYVGPFGPRNFFFVPRPRPYGRGYFLTALRASGRKLTFAHQSFHILRKAKEDPTLPDLTPSPPRDTHPRHCAGDC